MSFFNNTVERFNGKAVDYAKYRPAYPAEFLDYLFADNEVGLSIGKTVADVGAGTGIFSALLAERGAEVLCVEPNEEMRAQLVATMADLPYKLINARACETGIEAESVDCVTAAQAFHWFDRKLFRAECARILKPHGRVVLVWNTPDDRSRLMVEQERVRQTFCGGYVTQDHRDTKDPTKFSDFFRYGACVCRAFRNDRVADEETFIGRNLSSSWSPLRGDEQYQPFVDALHELFEKYQEHGMAELPEITRCFVGGVEK
ncbi:methyltransferase [Clostridia bacterium]|nr:methyltransferase [Clostridia bacterium]